MTAQAPLPKLLEERLRFHLCAEDHELIYCRYNTMVYARVDGKTVTLQTFVLPFDGFHAFVTCGTIPKSETLPPWLVVSNWRAL